MPGCSALKTDIGSSHRALWHRL